LRKIQKQQQRPLIECDDLTVAESVVVVVNREVESRIQRTSQTEMFGSAVADAFE
jgi:hypothetical protein